MLYFRRLSASSPPLAGAGRALPKFGSDLLGAEPGDFEGGMHGSHSRAARWTGRAGGGRVGTWASQPWPSWPPPWSRRSRPARSARRGRPPTSPNIGATLNGSVYSSLEGNTTWWFDYGDTPDYGSTTADGRSRSPTTTRIRSRLPSTGSCPTPRTTSGMCVKDGEEEPPRMICSKDNTFDDARGVAVRHPRGHRAACSTASPTASPASTSTTRTAAASAGTRWRTARARARRSTTIGPGQGGVPGLVLRVARDHRRASATGPRFDHTLAVARAQASRSSRR